MHMAASNVNLRKAGYMSSGYLNEKPPYAEPHVRWCERTVTRK